MRGIGTARIAAVVAAVALLAGCAGFPDPAELPGRYRSTGAPAALTIQEERWVLESGSLLKSGLWGASGNRVGLQLTDVDWKAFEGYCRDRADTYEWRLREGALVLRAVGEVCDPVAKAVLTAGPWERIGGSG